MESYGARLIFISIFLQTLIEQLSIAPPFERMFIFAVKLSASWGSRSVFHFFSSESWFIFARVSTCLPTPTTRMQMNAEWWVEKRPDAPVPGSGSSHAWRVSIGDVGSGSEADGGVGGGRGRHKRRFLKRPVDAGRHQPRAAPRLEKDVALYFFFFCVVPWKRRCCGRRRRCGCLMTSAGDTQFDCVRLTRALRPKSIKSTPTLVSPIQLAWNDDAFIGPWRVSRLPLSCDSICVLSLPDRP